MQVAYVTRKYFPDDSEEVRIKIKKKVTPESVNKALATRKNNAILREYRRSCIEREILNLRLYDSQYARKLRRLRGELKLRNVGDVVRSAQRCRQSLYDICRCNEFIYFVTWTFDKTKVDRLDDVKVRRKFTEFQNYLRKKFPQMFYIAVPEYHKKGGLHFHLLVGGITLEELKAVPAITKHGNLKFKNGKQIYNVTRWRLGFSELSIICNGEAAKHYICKYISKQNLDERFFNKRRYYVSHNIRRPRIEKQCLMPSHCLDGIDDNVYLVEFLDPYEKYAVLSRNADGIVNKTMNAQEVKIDLRRLRAGARWAACPPKRALARVRYLTLRTLNSNFVYGIKKPRQLLLKPEPIAKSDIISEEELRDIGLID